jgi:hypothetical protein
VKRTQQHVLQEFLPTLILLCEPAKGGDAIRDTEANANEVLTPRFFAVDINSMTLKTI